MRFYWLAFGWTVILLAVALLAGVIYLVAFGAGDGTLLLRGILATPFGLWWGIKTVKANYKVKPKAGSVQSISRRA
jgi:hypothetical protein